jgi:hypothetical protein
MLLSLPSIMSASLGSLSLGVPRGNPHYAQISGLRYKGGPGNASGQLECMARGFTEDTISAPLLIMEADATETEWYKEEIEVPGDADILYLGYSALRPDGHGFSYKGPLLYEAYSSPSLVRIRAALGGHATLLITPAGKSFYRRAAFDAIRKETHIDAIAYGALSDSGLFAYAPRFPFYWQGPASNIHARNTYFHLCPETGEAIPHSL